MNSAAMRVKNPLTRRLLRRVLFFSGVLIVLLAGARAWWEYQRTLEAVSGEFEVIESTKAKSVAASLWDFDREQLLLHVEGIRHFRYITFASVRDARGVVVQSGERRDKGVLDREIALRIVYNGQRLELGVLHLQADLVALRGEALRTAWGVLVFNAGIVLLVAGLMFWLTSRMVSRHLAAVAAHLGAFTLGGDNTPLALDKKPAGDELDMLAQTLNSMQEGLLRSYAQVLAAQTEVRSMARFYQENPSPVLRVSASGQLLMANNASAELLAHLGLSVGNTLPDEYASFAARALQQGDVQHFERDLAGRSYAFGVRPVPADGYVNVYGLDITERKAAEVALRKSEAILQAAMDQSQAGIAIADAPSGRLRYVNKAGLMIRGLAEAETVLGVDVSQYVGGWKMLDLDGRPLETTEVPLARAVLYGETNSREFVIRRAEGDDRIVWANAAPILDDHGQVSAGIVVFLDITARKKAEEALRKSEETFRAMVETIPLAIYLSTGLEQVSHYVNPTFRKLFGYSLEEVPTAGHWWPLAYPDEQYRQQVVTEWTKRVERAIETQTPIDPMEVVCTCKDGSQKTVSWGYMTLGNTNYAYGLDLTERKKAEEEVRSHNAWLESLVRVLQHKADSVQEYLDYALTESLGLTGSRIGYIYHYSEERQEFVLNTWSSEVMAECAVAGAPQVYQLEKTGIWGEAVRQRKAIVLNDFEAPNPLKRGYPEGHVALKNFMTVPVIQGERIVAVAGVGNKQGDYQDVDVQQLDLLMNSCWQVVGRLDAELDVRNSLHEKEILLKEIHHRVKNNLQVISSLLFLQAEYVIDPQDRAMFEESQKRISAMALVHEELYGSGDLSSVAMGEYVPRLVERVVASSDEGVQLDFAVQEMRLPITRSIPCGLVLNEMVMNAVKHAFKGGQEARLRVALERTDGHIELSVEDNGPGLPLNFSLESPATLGLTLITSLARQLGGTVSAQTTASGALFRLVFPVEERT